MPNLFIPVSGDEFVLSRDWTFRLYAYRMNRTLCRVLNPEFSPTDSWVGEYWAGCTFANGINHFVATMPAGTRIVFSKSSRHTWQSGRNRNELTTNSIVFVNFKLPRGQINNNRACTFKVLLEDTRLITYV